MQNEFINKDEIDLIELFSEIWKERRYIWYSLGFFFLLGLIIAFTSKEEYTSEVKLIPEGRQQSFSVGLAQQFGIGNFQTPTSSEVISTRFYPDIAKSFPFLIPVMDYKFYYAEINDSISIRRFFTEFHSDATFVSRLKTTVMKYTIRLPFTISGWINKKQDIKVSDLYMSSIDDTVIVKPKDIITLNNREFGVVSILRRRITVKNEDGIIKISAKMPDPIMAADLADHITNSLIGFIETHHTEKAKTDMEFVEERYDEVKLRFEKSQENLARFRDQNFGQLTQLARTEEQRLQSEYDLAFNIYNTIARRLEEAKLKLQEETPVVQVLEPAVVPITISEPRREFILTVYLILGIIFGLGWIFIRTLKRRMIPKV
jgi:capsular polysaccharide biosynthesis protein